VLPIGGFWIIPSPMVIDNPKEELGGAAWSETREAHSDSGAYPVSLSIRRFNKRVDPEGVHYSRKTDSFRGSQRTQGFQ
jgi:hypothetical protein